MHRVLWLTQQDNLHSDELPSKSFNPSSYSYIHNMYIYNYTYIYIYVYQEVVAFRYFVPLSLLALHTVFRAHLWQKRKPAMLHPTLIQRIALRSQGPSDLSCCRLLALRDSSKMDGLHSPLLLWWRSHDIKILPNPCLALWPLKHIGQHFANFFQGLLDSFF